MVKKTYTKSEEDYLEAILILSRTSKTVKSVDVAKMLSVSKPAVNLAMNDLLEKGLISKEAYSGIELTNKGRQVAQKVYDKHNHLKQFLINIGVSEETSEKDCCLIEHVISQETLDKIIEFNTNI